MHHHDDILTEDIGHRRGGEQQENETNDVVGVLLQMSHAKIVLIFSETRKREHQAQTYDESEPDGAQDNRDDKVPANTMKGSLMGIFEPLIDDKASQEDVNKSPQVFDPERFMMMMILALHGGGGPIHV